MSPDNPPNKRQLAVCPTHGLTYDTATHDACLLCKRSQAEASSRTGKLGVIALGLVVVSTILGVAVYKRRATPPATATTVRIQEPVAAVKPPGEQREPAPAAMNPDALPSDVAGDPLYANMPTVYLAASNGSGTALKRLLAQGLSIEGPEPHDGETSPLSAAIEKGHRALALWMLKQGAKASVPRAIIGATKQRWPDVVSALIEHGAGPDTPTMFDIDNYPCTPLYLAVQNGDLETAAVLQSHGAKVDTGDRFGFTPLMAACMATPERAPYAVQWLLDHGARIDRVSQRNEWAFSVCSLRGRVEAARLLVLNGADINLMPRPEMGAPIPMLGSLARPDFEHPQDAPTQLRTIRALLSLGINARPAVQHIDACTNCTYGEPWIGEDLIRTAAKKGSGFSAYDVVDAGGNTQLHWAAGMGEPTLIKRLLETGLDIDRMSQGPNELSLQYDAAATPLHLAAAYGHVEAVQLLLERGAKANILDGKGRLAAAVVSTLKSNRYENLGWGKSADDAHERELAIAKLLAAAPAQ